MSSTTKTYTIGELAGEANVTTRTIRYYVSEGLLAPPEKGGRAASYNDEHLARLALIKILKEEFLPLQEIASLLNGLDKQAVFELLKEKQKAEIPAPTPNSAKAYLQTLLNPPNSVAETPTLMRHRLQAKKEVAEEPSLPAHPRATPHGVKSTDPSAMPSAAKARPGETESTTADLTTGAAESAPTVDSAEAIASATQWQRIQITPDIELHIRSGLEKTSVRQKIEQLIKITHHLFNSIIT
jgi:DNA-binding transcriptional MerR regulator